MRVLWFSLSPCGSLRRSFQQKFTQTWMVTLEDELKNNPEIELHVAYYSSVDEPSFTFEKVNYWPVYTGFKSTYEKLINRFSSIENKNNRFLPLLLNVVDMVKPDLIHIHGTESNFGMIANISDVPIVYSIQGLISPIIDKFYAGLPKEYVNSDFPLKKRLRGLRPDNYYQSLLYISKCEQEYLRKARFIIGRTSWDKDITRLISPNSKYFIVDEIMRQEFFTTQWNKSSFSTPLKLISTLSAGTYKGYETILRAASHLKRFLNMQIEWNVIGVEQHDHIFEAAVSYTGINPAEVNVILLGRKVASEMVQIMTESDIFVQTGHIENSPNALCEAMVLGMPCIASNVGGTSTMMKDGKEGILYQPGESYILAAEIKKMADNFKCAISLGKAARSNAIIRHSPTHVTNQLISVYKTIYYKTIS